MRLLIIFLISFNTIFLVTAGLTDYVMGIKSYFGYEQESEIFETEIYDKKIPYEVSAIDENFLNEAAKLTGVALSELDSCQQRVVLKMQSDCQRMNDEQLAKMAVHLLNCQSYVEGRQIFPCTEEMSIKDCTIRMDSDTWTSYHLMSNRARAVCYSIRQSQFRGLAEHTVNRLMEAAREQLRTLGKLSGDQEQIKTIADKTLDSLNRGHETLSKQQEDMQKAQLFGQLSIEDNIKRLSDEKRLISDTHKHLVKMTQRVQDKLELSLQQLEDQSDTSRLNHRELIDDLITIQAKAKDIFERIDESSSLLLQQNEKFQDQYDLTLRSLKEVNDTVNNLVTLIGGTRQTLEEKLTWIKTALGGTDLAVERLYVVLWHSAFMLLAMLTCAFLTARLSTRLVVATLPPVNLGVALYGRQEYLDPILLAAAIGGFVFAQTVILSAISLRPTAKKAIAGIRSQLTPKKEALASDDDSNNQNPASALSSTNYQTKEATSSSHFNGSHTRSEMVNDLDDDAFNETDNFKDFDFTPPVSRNGDYPFMSRSRSRSNTPLLLNTSGRGSCQAKTRVGTPCKITSLPGRLYCYRHQSGDSVIG